VELNLKLNEEIMHWQIDKNQDDSQLTTLQKSALGLSPAAPAAICSRTIAEKLDKK
jgi:hypothetical protein